MKLSARRAGTMALSSAVLALGLVTISPASPAHASGAAVQLFDSNHLPHQKWQ